MPMIVAKTTDFRDNYNVLIRNVDYLKSQIKLFEIYSKFKNNSPETVAQAESVLLKNTSYIIFSHKELFYFAQRVAKSKCPATDSLEKMGKELQQIYADGSPVACIFDKMFAARLGAFDDSMRKVNDILTKDCSKEENISLTKKLNDLQVKLPNQFELLTKLDQSTGIGFTENQVQTIRSYADLFIATTFKIKNYVDSLQK